MSYFAATCLSRDQDRFRHAHGFGNADEMGSADDDTAGNVAGLEGAKPRNPMPLAGKSGRWGSGGRRTYVPRPPPERSGAEVVGLYARFLLQPLSTVGKGLDEVEVVVGRDTVMTMLGTAQTAVDDREFTVGANEMTDGRHLRTTVRSAVARPGAVHVAGMKAVGTVIAMPTARRRRPHHQLTVAATEGLLTAGCPLRAGFSAISPGQGVALLTLPTPRGEIGRRSMK